MTVLSQSFLFGLLNSVHCAAMCGPLAACLVGSGRVRLLYHIGRTSAYAGAGAVFGAAGVLLGAERLPGQGAAVTLVLAATLLAFAFGLDRRLGALPGIGRVLQHVTARLRALPAGARAMALGALTPLLPCGVLYGIYGAALLSGAWTSGALVMAGFAAGSLPLLAVGQWQVGWLARKLAPRQLRALQAALMVLAAGLLAWRGVLDLGASDCCGGAPPPMEIGELVGARG